MQNQKMIEGLYTHTEAAAFMGISKQTLYNWRSQRKGPDYVMMGRKPMYEGDSLRRFRDANRIKLNTYEV